MGHLPQTVTPIEGSLLQGVVRGRRPLPHPVRLLSLTVTVVSERLGSLFQRSLPISSILYLSQFQAHPLSFLQTTSCSDLASRSATTRDFLSCQEMNLTNWSIMIIK